MQYFINGQLYTINRCAGTGIGFDISKYIYFMQTQRLTNRDRMTHTGLGFVGSHYD